MISISSTRFDTEVDRDQDDAHGQPVIVTPNGRDRHVVAAGELSDDLVDAVRRSEMDARQSHLDGLIPD